jgi:hypothetical protein
MKYGWFLSVTLDRRPEPILVSLDADDEGAAIEESIDILESMIGWCDAWILHRSAGGARTIEIEGQF